MKEMNLFDDMYNGFVVEDSMIVQTESEGAEDKFWINVNGRRYLVKDSSYDKKRKQNSLAPYCEYVASNFIRLSRILECQKCYLGKYNGRDVVICEDLFSDCQFQPFKELHQSSAGTDIEEKEYTYSDVLYILKQKSKLPNSEISDYLYHFWLMFLFDAILANRDRHEGNWGFVKKKGTVSFAPIFDNGASLFPGVDLANVKYSVEFIKDRVFNYPGSQFKMWKTDYKDRPMRTNFYEIIMKYSDNFQDEIDIISRLDYKDLINKSLRGVPDEYHKWFGTIIECRFRCLILKEKLEDFGVDCLWV